MERITEKNEKSHISLLYMPHILYQSCQHLSLTSSRSETNSLTGVSSFFGLVACSYNSLQLGECFAGSLLSWMIAESHSTVLHLSLLHHVLSFETCSYILYNLIIQIQISLTTDNLYLACLVIQ